MSAPLTLGQIEEGMDERDRLTKRIRRFMPLALDAMKKSKVMEGLDGNSSTKHGETGVWVFSYNNDEVLFNLRPFRLAPWLTLWVTRDDGGKASFFKFDRREDFPSLSDLSLNELYRLAKGVEALFAWMTKEFPEISSYLNRQFLLPEQLVCGSSENS